MQLGGRRFPYRRFGAPADPLLPKSFSNAETAEIAESAKGGDFPRITRMTRITDQTQPSIRVLPAPSAENLPWPPVNNNSRNGHMCRYNKGVYYLSLLPCLSSSPPSLLRSLGAMISRACNWKSPGVRTSWRVWSSPILRLTPPCGARRKKRSSLGTGARKSIRPGRASRPAEPKHSCAPQPERLFVALRSPL